MHRLGDLGEFGRQRIDHLGQAAERARQHDARHVGDAVFPDIVARHQTAIGPRHDNRAHEAGRAHHRCDIVGGAPDVAVRQRVRRLGRSAVTAQVERDEVVARCERRAELPPERQLALPEAVQKQDPRQLPVAFLHDRQLDPVGRAHGRVRQRGQGRLRAQEVNEHRKRRGPPEFRGPACTARVGTPTHEDIPIRARTRIYTTRAPRSGVCREAVR